MSEQKILYEANHPALGNRALPLTTAALLFEKSWIEQSIADIELERTEQPIDSLEAFKAAVQRSLTAGSAHARASSFIAEEATRDHLQSILSEYALDGLTEAQAMFAALPRLDPASQAPVMRILIDEYGCGNPAKVHAALYANLLEELGLETSLAHYLREERMVESYAFVNIYHWLTRRAPTIDYYLGALYYTESSIPLAFACFMAACERLGIRSHAYFSEHVHIDGYHARDAGLALKLRHKSAGVDFHHAWLGAKLAKRMGDTLFEQVIGKCIAPSRTFQVWSNGKLYCVPARCPHRGGDLSKGYLRNDGHSITCPLHGATFALPSGDRIAGPDCVGLVVEEAKLNVLTEQRG